MSGSRGVSWQEQEILDLLALWGDGKVQEALLSTSRNYPTFQKISLEMAKRGHQRSPDECRTKTKTMRLRYRQVVDHNSKPGNRRMTCPYYRELHQILKGNGDMRVGRVVYAVTVKDEAPTELHAQDPFCPETPAVSLEDVKPNIHGDPQAHLEEAVGDEAVGKDFIVPKTIDEEEPGPSNQCNPPQAEPHTTEEEPGRLTRVRRKRPYGLYGVAEKMLEQSDRQHASQLAQKNSQHADYMEAKRNELELHREEMLESREDRRMLQEALAQHNELLQSCSQTLSRLTALLERELQNPQQGEPSEPLTHGGGRGRRKNSRVP